MLNLKHFFGELHRCLEVREQQIMEIYEEYCKDFKVEYIADIAKLGKIKEQMGKIHKRVETMGRGFETANEIAVVGSVDKVKELGKNFQLFTTRLAKMYPPS